MTGILLIVAAVFGTESDPVLTQEILWELDAIATFANEDLLLVGSEVRHVAMPEDWRDSPKWSPNVACEMVVTQ